MTEEVLITARNLSVRFGDQQPSIHNVSVDFPVGSLTAIVGPSGCGKTTLLRCIASLTQPTAGELRIGRSALPNPRVGFVFQSPNLLPWRSAIENISLPLELQNVSKSERMQRARECFKMVGLLEQDAVKLPKMLSGGMQMRVSLARALVTEPEILLLDEPFAALDDMLRQRLNEELLDLWQKKNWTTVFVTHNVQEAAFLAQQVLIMTARPGTIASSVDVRFEYPRRPELRADSRFAELTGSVSTKLREVSS